MRQALTSIIGATSLLGLGVWQANAYPNPEPINGTIPHNSNATIDPSLIRRKTDGKLFLYTTGSGPTDNLGGYVWTADSLYGPWTKSDDSALNEECDAPNIFEADDGTYYMFYAQPFDWPALGYTNVNASSDTHNKALYVRNSTTLEPLSWGDEPNGTRLLIDWSQSYNQLDINVILSEEGQYLASFGSYQAGLYQIPLEATLDAVINGSDTTYFNMNGNSINHLVENFTWITDPVPNTDLIEASFQFYWDGYYYLFFSSGHAQTQPVGDISIWSSAGDVYKIMVCRSATATGSFVDQSGQSCLNSGGTEILGTHDLIWAPGGQGVLNDTEVGGPIIYYHYVPRTSTDEAPIGGGYNFGWNKLDFSSGWPVLLDPETESTTSATATATATAKAKATATANAVTSSSTATSVSSQTTSGSSTIAATANSTSPGISVSPSSSTRWICTIIFLYLAWGI